MVDFRLKGAGGKATAKRFRTSNRDHCLTQTVDKRVGSRGQENFDQSDISQVSAVADIFTIS
jgi:hypothetical protein